MLFTKAESKEWIEANVDVYGDGYARDLEPDELQAVSILLFSFFSPYETV